jgi:hypothetical protein
MEVDWEVGMTEGMMSPSRSLEKSSEDMAWCSLSERVRNWREREEREEKETATSLCEGRSRCGKECKACAQVAAKTCSHDGGVDGRAATKKAAIFFPRSGEERGEHDDDYNTCTAG